MLLRKALKLLLRYRSLSATSSGNSVKITPKAHNCRSLQSLTFEPIISQGKPQQKSLQTKDATASTFNRDKPNLSTLLIMTTVSKGVMFFPTLANSLISKLKGLQSLTRLKYVEDQDPPGTYKAPAHGHDKILEEQQKQLEALKNKQKPKSVWNKILPGSKEDFPKYNPKE